MIGHSPPGLIYRRTFPVGDGRWILEEKWDIRVPGCPMIKSPWHSPFEGDVFIRQVEMTAKEHDAYSSLMQEKK